MPEDYFKQRRPTQQSMGVAVLHLESFVHLWWMSSGQMEGMLYVLENPVV